MQFHSCAFEDEKPFGKKLNTIAGADFQ